jgi:hypothetical protein
MMLDEEDDFIQQIMANCDTAVSAAAGSTTQTCTYKGTVMEREVNDADFVGSGG